MGCLNLAPFNIGRNSITGPHFVNMDFSVHKTFPISRIWEAFNIQFRAEFFDIANHANFIPPQPNSGDSKSGILNPDGSHAARQIRVYHPVCERTTTFEGNPVCPQGKLVVSTLTATQMPVRLRRTGICFFQQNQID